MKTITEFSGNIIRQAAALRAAAQPAGELVAAPAKEPPRAADVDATGGAAESADAAPAAAEAVATNVCAGTMTSCPAPTPAARSDMCSAS